MLRQLLAEQALLGCVAPRCGPMAAADREGRRPRARGDKANDPGRQYDHREWYAAEEDRDKGDGCQRDHRAAPQRTAADAIDCVEHDGQHRRLEAEEQGDHDRDVAERRVHPAQRHDCNDAGQDKQATRDHCTRPAVH